MKFVMPDETSLATEVEDKATKCCVVVDGRRLSAGSNLGSDVPGTTRTYLRIRGGRTHGLLVCEFEPQIA